MRVHYDGQNIKLDIYELIDSLPDDAKLDLIESLSCQEAVIKHVSDQILEGWTERGFCGARGSLRSPPSSSLEVAIREVAKRSSDTAREEIEILEKALEASENRVREIEEKYWDLYHQRYSV